MVADKQRTWFRFALILFFMAWLLRVSPALTNLAPFTPTDWHFYLVSQLLLLAGYYPLAGYPTEQWTRRRWVLVLAGLLLYAVVSWATNIFRYPGITSITLRLGVVIPLLWGLKLGPAAGFVVGAGGNHLGDMLTGWGFFPMWNVGNGLMGLVAGLVYLAPASPRLVRFLLAAEFVLLAVLGIVQWWGTAATIWVWVYGWLLLMAAVTWVNCERRPRGAKAVAWGTAGVLAGMAVATTAEIWTVPLSFHDMITKNLVVVVGANLLFVQTLLPVLYRAWQED